MPEFFEADLAILLDVMQLERLIDLLLSQVLAETHHGLDNVFARDVVRIIDVEVTEDHPEFLLCEEVLDRDRCGQELGVVDLAVLMNVYVVLDLFYLLIGQLDVAVRDYLGQLFVRYKACPVLIDLLEELAQWVNVFALHHRHKHIDAGHAHERHATIVHQVLEGLLIEMDFLHCLLPLEAIHLLHFVALCHPRVLEGLLGRDAHARVLRQHLCDEVFTLWRDLLPGRPEEQ